MAGKRPVTTSGVMQTNSGVIKTSSGNFFYIGTVNEGEKLNQGDLSSTGVTFPFDAPAVCAGVNETYVYYVTDDTPTRVAKFKQSDGTEVDSFSLNTHQVSVTFGGDGNLYVGDDSDSDGNLEIVQLNPSDMSETGRVETSVGVDWTPIGKYDWGYDDMLYVGGEKNGTKMAKVDPSTMSEDATFSGSGPLIQPAHASNSNVYVKEGNGGPLYELDSSLNQVSSTSLTATDVTSQDDGTVYGSDGYLYASHGSRVHKIDPSNLNSVDSVELESSQFANLIHVDTGSGRELYAGGGGAGSPNRGALYKIDPSDMSILASDTSSWTDLQDISMSKPDYKLG